MTVITARVSSALEQTQLDAATDVVGGKDYQYVKAVFGADGTITKVSASDPLPVTDVPAVNQAVNTTVSVDTTVGGTELLAASATRKGWSVMPESLVYIAVGADPTSSSFPVQAYQVFSPPVNMTGQVKALSPSGSVNVWVFAC